MGANAADPTKLRNPSQATPLAKAAWSRLPLCFPQTLPTSMVLPGKKVLPMPERRLRATAWRDGRRANSIQTARTALFPLHFTPPP